MDFTHDTLKVVSSSRGNDFTIEFAGRQFRDTNGEVAALMAAKEVHNKKEYQGKWDKRKIKKAAEEQGKTLINKYNYLFDEAEAAAGVSAGDVIGPRESDPILVIFLGLPGSGKSYVYDMFDRLQAGRDYNSSHSLIKQFLNHNILLLDKDEVKLPHDLTPGKTEARDYAKFMTEAALIEGAKKNISMGYLGTGKTTTKMMKRIQPFVKTRYKIITVRVICHVCEANESVMNRLPGAPNKFSCARFVEIASQVYNEFANKKSLENHIKEAFGGDRVKSYWLFNSADSRETYAIDLPNAIRISGEVEKLTNALSGHEGSRGDVGDEAGCREVLQACKELEEEKGGAHSTKKLTDTGAKVVTISRGNIAVAAAPKEPSASGQHTQRLKKKGGNKKTKKISKRKRKCKTRKRKKKRRPHRRH